MSDHSLNRDETFYDKLSMVSWDQVKQSIYSKTEEDVQIALNKSNLNLEDFTALIS
ncbi:MAG: 2-iminoacetate synthase, partial [Parvicellaceae bacterium]